MIIDEDSMIDRNKLYKTEMKHFLYLKLPKNYYITYGHNGIFYVYEQWWKIFHTKIAYFWKEKDKIVIHFDTKDDYLSLKRSLIESLNKFVIDFSGEE